MEEPDIQPKFTDIKTLEYKYNISFELLGEEYYPIIIKLFNSQNIDLEDYDLENITNLLLIASYYQLVRQDQVSAKKFYEQASEKGSEFAMEELGDYYAKVGNEELMVKYYKMAIIGQLTEPLIKLGLHYKTKKEYGLMKKYFDLGIVKSNPECAYQLGLYYHFNEKDNELAKKYYLIAGEYLHPQALYELAKYYRYVETNPELHIKYLDLAMENNSDEAYLYAGQKEVLYCKKKEYLQKAVDLGNIQAIFELGRAIWAKEQDKVKVKELWKLGADLAHGECAYQLSAYYMEIESNPELSLKYLTLAAEQGVAEAMFTLGNILIEKKDYEPAVKYYKLAIKQGHARAMYNLGIYYQIIVRNKSISNLYYKRASDKGILEATKKLYLHYKNVEPNEKLKKKYMDILHNHEHDVMTKNIIGHRLNNVMSLLGMFVD